MRKLFSFLFICLVVSANARQITADEAASIASEFLNSSASVQKSGKRANVRRAPAKDASAGKEDNQPYYVFNASDDKGFVIISGDDRAKKILGYSDTGNFDMNNMPPQLAAMLNQYSEQISKLEGGVTDPSWSAPARVDSEDEGILLETANWGQGYPYNAQCPVIDGVQAPTGCVATAMAIVMKYHNWPEQGKRKHEYWDQWQAEKRSYDFGNYSPCWDKMLMEYKNENYSEYEANAIADLMHATGIASNMNYSQTESGASILGIMTSLRRFFSYSHKMEEITASEYNQESWKSKVKNSLNLDCPVLYYGSGTGAHAFVIDGHNNNNLFHVNWGWDGECNGYYQLDQLMPLSYNFSEDSGMIGLIKPELDDNSIWSDFFTANEKYYPGLGSLTQPNISVTDVKTGEPFDIAWPTLIFPPYSTSKIGIAITDKDYNIKEVLGGCKVFGGGDRIGFNFPGGYHQCVANCDIADSDSIFIAVMEDGDNKWRLVNSSPFVKSCISVKNNQPLVCNVNWEIDPRMGIEVKGADGKEWSATVACLSAEDTKNKYSQLLKGMSYQFNPSQEIDANRGIYSAIQVNGETVDLCVGKVEVLASCALLGIMPMEDTLSIRMLALFPGDEKSESINLEEVESLESLLNSNSYDHVTRLKLKGIGSLDDYKLIRNSMPFLGTLDISEYHPENKTIPAYAFSGLMNLDNINLPENVEIIEEGAFSGCPIETVVIPADVKKIESLSFSGLSSFFDSKGLSAVHSKAIAPPIMSEYAFGNTSNTTLYVMPGCRDQYLMDNEWSKFGEIIEDSNPTLEVNETIVNGIKYKLYPSHASIIGADKDNCPEEVEFESVITYNGREFPVKEIEYHAFLYNDKLKKVIIPKSVTKLSSGTFSCCRNLESAIIKAGISVLPMNTFEQCFSLINIQLPEGLEVIGQYALSDAYSLKELILPSTLKEIEWNGITRTQNLESIYIPENNKNFNLLNGSLYSGDMSTLICHCNGNDSFTEINIPEGVKVIHWFLFSNRFIKTIKLPTTVDNLPLGLHRPLRDNDFEQLVIPDHITQFMEGCFNMPRHLTIGKNVNSIGNQWGCYDDIVYNIYCNNEVAFNVTDLNRSIYAPRWNYFSANIEPNLSFGINNPNEYFDVNAYHFYIPGGANWNTCGNKSENIHQMWTYLIDRSNKLLLIQPLIDGIIIDKVTIDGIEVSPKNKFLYSFTEDGNPNVTIDFTLNNRQSMTTHYDAEFNASMPNTALSKVTGIALNKKELDLYVGETFSLMATVSPDYALNKDIVWTSSNDEVAKVNADGNVTAIALGSAIITAQAGDVKATCDVTVVPTLVEYIEIDLSEISAEVGQTVQLTATVIPDDATNRELIWESSDVKVATVDDSGLVTVTGEGDAVITVSTTDGSGLSATCKVNGTTGVEAIFAKPDAKLTIYTPTGILLKRDADTEYLKRLKPGIYIVNGKKVQIQ